MENLSDNASTEHGIPGIVPEKELSVRCAEYDYDKQDSDLSSDSSEADEADSSLAALCAHIYPLICFLKL